MKANAAWHDHNKMPFRPTLEARVRWHLEHAKACACRPIPKGVMAEIERLRQEMDGKPRDDREVL